MDFKGSVTMDGLGVSVEGWLREGNLWNGWENPWISRDSVMVITDAINTWNSEVGEPGLTLEWHGDALHVIDGLYPGEPPYIIDPEVAPDGSTVYPFLTYGYCWYLEYAIEGRSYND